MSARAWRSLASGQEDQQIFTIILDLGNGPTTGHRNRGDELMIGFSLGLNGAGHAVRRACLSATPVAEIDIYFGAKARWLSRSLAKTSRSPITEHRVGGMATYVVDQSAFGGRPGQSGAARILPAGVATAGDSLAITPGLWVYDIDNGNAHDRRYVHDGSGSISGLG